METNDKKGALEAAEIEIANIVKQRATTAFEKRSVTLNKELEITRNEAAQRNMGRSGPLIKRILEIRSQAVRDIVFDRFNIAKALHSEYRIPWTERSLGSLAEDLKQWTEGQFSAQKRSLHEEVSRGFKPDDQIVKWALDAFERERQTQCRDIKGNGGYALRNETSGNDGGSKPG